ncbi:MAG: hypothetical protein SV765_08220 [Pseudomonadota bacterium]|nr:hypothetical protein [Pseudomonadota bacterium]
MPRYGLQACLLLLGFCTGALAQEPAPPAAFWDYYLNYSDRDGQVFDPLDLAQTQRLARDNPEPEQQPAPHRAAAGSTQQEESSP